MNLTFERLRQINEQRCALAFHPIAEWSPLEWAGAMCGEAGEAANKAKKIKRLEKADLDKASPQELFNLVSQTLDEVADTIIYGDLLATRLKQLCPEAGSLEDAIVRKFNEVSDRRNCEIKL